MTKLAGEMQHTHLLTTDRELLTDQSTNTTKVQLAKPMSFIGVIYRSMDEGFLTGAEIICRELIHQGPPQYVWQLTKLGMWGTQWSLWAAKQVENVLSSCLSWSQPLPSSLAGFCLSQAAGLVWEFFVGLAFFFLIIVVYFWQVGCSERDSELLRLNLVGEGPSDSGQFQGLPSALLELLAFLLKELPCRMECFDLWGNCYITAYIWRSETYFRYQNSDAIHLIFRLFWVFFFFVVGLFVCFWDGVSLCSPNCPRTCSID